MTKQYTIDDLKKAVNSIHEYIEQVEIRKSRDEMRLSPPGWMDVAQFVKEAQFVSSSYLHTMINNHKENYPERISKIGHKFYFDGDWMLGLILKKGNRLMVNKFKIFYPHVESLKMMFGSLVLKSPGQFKEFN